MFTEVKETLKNQKGIIMKITRVLTYNISEDYVRDYFDECWWKDKIEPDETEYDFFIDTIRDNGYDDEEIILQPSDKERIMQIWQEECDKYNHRELENPITIKEQILNELQYYKNKVAQLEKWLKDA